MTGTPNLSLAGWGVRRGPAPSRYVDPNSRDQAKGSRFSGLLLVVMCATHCVAGLGLAAQ